MARDILTDEQRERLGPLLPPQKPGTGRPAKSHRTVLEVTLWIDRTGAPWRDLPPEYGPWQTAATRFYRWVNEGIWDEILATYSSRPTPMATWTGAFIMSIGYEFWNRL